MSTIYRIAAAAAVAAIAAGCAGDPSVNREAELELAPMEKPAVVVGRVSLLDKGEPVVFERASLGDGKMSGAWVEGKRKGCNWVSDGWFGPSASWENCGGSTGTQDMTKSGDIWPLAVGKVETYEVSGQNDKNNSWKTTRRCEVKAAVTVTIQDKQYTSYEVVCKNSWNTYTWYVSPELKRVIKYNRRHKDRGLVTDIVAVLE